VLSQARQLDAVPQELRGPLHGVPVGVKDIFYTKGPLKQVCVETDIQTVR
jgi:Asp-tRNA(Asn)/Glu-tRNA(Gln) amidotransferase A subunit family amidase